MQLFIQGSRVHALEVCQETRVSEVKEALSGLEEVASEDQVLYYGGLPLEDDSFVCEAIPENGTLSLAVRLLGGVLTLINAHSKCESELLSMYREGSWFLGTCWQSQRSNS